MLFSDETKKRFVKMLNDRQIIVIQNSMVKRKTFALKFIGANDCGKWDFTPLIASESGFPRTELTSIYNTAVFANDAVDVVCKALEKLIAESGKIDYFEVREKLTFFYF